MPPTATSSSGAGKRQRLEEHRVDHAEDGGVRADPEREGEHGDQGEAGMLDQLAQSVANVGHHMGGSGSVDHADESDLMRCRMSGSSLGQRFVISFGSQCDDWDPPASRAAPAATPR